MSPSIRELMQGALPVTAPLVLNPLMARMVEAAGFPAGYLGGGSTGYQKVALEANLNLTEIARPRSRSAPSPRCPSSWTAPAATGTRCTCTARSA